MIVSMIMLVMMSQALMLMSVMVSVIMMSMMMSMRAPMMALVKMPMMLQLPVRDAGPKATSILKTTSFTHVC